MSNYSNIPTPMLESMWREKCRHIREGHRLPGDMDEVFLMRRELDKRSGVRNPTTEINYEKYLTD